MAIIKQLTLFDSNEEVFPITKTNAVYNDDDESLESILGNIGIRKIWTRTLTGSNDCGAGSVSLDLSGYIFLIIKCKNRFQLESNSAETTYPGYTTGIVWVDGKQHWISGGTNTDSNICFRRRFTATTTTLSWTTSNWGNTGSGADVVLPVEVWGVYLPIKD